MLIIDNINVAYGKVQVLHDVSLVVNVNEIVTIIGSNGAGKTTTLNAIMGALKPTKGRIEFLNKRIDQLDSNRIVASGISIVPEGRRMFPDFSVYENLLTGACARRMHGIKAAEVEEDIREMYELFPRLKERQKQKAWSLSGGEQQMLAIARSLVSKPKLLLLDEPSLGLAPLLVREVFETIKSINRKGTTILLVEQNANMALEHSDRAYVIESGRIVIEGTADELKHSEKVRKAYLGG